MANAHYQKFFKHATDVSVDGMAEKQYKVVIALTTSSSNVPQNEDF